MFCSECGTELHENGKYCFVCGASASGDGNGTSRSSSSAPPTALKPLPSTTGQIVFSVVNIVTGVAFVFGVIALVFAILANEAKSFEDAVAKLRVARILNIVGVSLTGFFILIYLVFFVFFFGIMGLGFLTAFTG
jgi:uncharacterized membrane protein YvbJ